MSDPSLVVLPNPAQTDALADFCQAVLNRHSEQWPPTETDLAEEIVTLSGLHTILSFEEMAQFCRDRLQVSVSVTTMPAVMRGHNYRYGGQREILISETQDFSGAKIHTLLHELRELIEVEFVKLGRPIAEGDLDDLEERAESFASAVQVCAAGKFVPVLLENASTIERKWLRIGAYIVISLLGIGYALGCLALPRIEDAFAAERIQ